jgi:hypothetical protein
MKGGVYWHLWCAGFFFFLLSFFLWFWFWFYLVLRVRGCVGAWVRGWGLIFTEVKGGEEGQCKCKCNAIELLERGL